MRGPREQKLKPRCVSPEEGTEPARDMLGSGGVAGGRLRKGEGSGSHGWSLSRRGTCSFSRCRKRDLTSTGCRAECWVGGWDRSRRAPGGALGLPAQQPGVLENEGSAGRSVEVCDGRVPTWWQWKLRSQGGSGLSFEGLDELLEAWGRGHTLPDP